MCFIGHGAFGIITQGRLGAVLRGGGHRRRAGPTPSCRSSASSTSCSGSRCWSGRRRPPAPTWRSGALWTAMLRPLAGQGIAECLERAGNYGVPLALLLVGLAAFPRGRLVRADDAAARSMPGRRAASRGSSASRRPRSCSATACWPRPGSRCSCCTWLQRRRGRRRALHRDDAGPAGRLRDRPGHGRAGSVPAWPSCSSSSRGRSGPSSSSRSPATPSGSSSSAAAATALRWRC